MESSRLPLHPQLAAQLPILNAIAKLFHPYVEVVLHDLKTGKVAAVYNDLSRTAVGDRSAISKFVGEQAEAFPEVFEPYYKTNWDGSQLKCIAATVRDSDGKAVGLACVNFDASIFQDIQTQIGQLLAVGSDDALSPIEQFTDDWPQRVNECINNYLAENQLALKTLTPEQKRAVTSRLYAHGLFNYRKAAAFVGDRLGVSRATIYNYLKEG